MILSQIFNFKGNILPVIDSKDKLYFFIKNENNQRVLLNIVSSKINKFVSINAHSVKLVSVGEFNINSHFKIFYMGQELFDYLSTDIDKKSLILYSNYILNTVVDVDRITFSISFRDGLKVTSTANKPQNLFIQIINKSTNEILREDNFISIEPYFYKSSCFIDYRIIILNSSGIKIYQCDLDLKDKKIWIKLNSKSLGDTLAWIPYVDEFRKKYNCEVFCTTYWNTLFEGQYPYLKFVPVDAIVESKTLFALYEVNCSIPHNQSESIVDYRDVGLQELASKNLGLEYKEIRPKVVFDKNDSSPIDGEYVAISTASTSKAKLWNNVGGWQKVIDHLFSKGLKVVLIQREKSDEFRNVINKSGTNDIHETIKILRHCKFYIGLSSGVSWLSWALGKKVVMISGFTNPIVEFKENCHRIINTSVCHGCWNDKNYTFDRKDWFWCPRNKNFECSKEIKSDIVIQEVNKILENQNVII